MLQLKWVWKLRETRIRRWRKRMRIFHLPFEKEIETTREESRRPEIGIPIDIGETAGFRILGIQGWRTAL
jgi:hypothetical protein